MVQRYTEIPVTQKICESLTPLLNNDKTALSCSAGTTFPTADLVDGMLCFRTDEKKLYQLTDTKDPVKNWRLVADLTADFRHLDGGNGNAINYNYKDLNNWEKMPTGFYEGVSMLNAPPSGEGDDAETQWRVLQFRHGNSDGWATQIAFAFNKDLTMTRTQRGGDWTPWVKVLSAKTDGSVVEGLNSDKLDGYHASNDASSIPISNGTVNANLNADKLDGYHAGNGQSEIPVSNALKNLNLNADMLDDYHAGHKKGQIPIADGTLCSGLNAEMVGGYSIKSLVTQGGNNTVNNMNFTTASSGSFTVTGTDQLNANFNVSNSTGAQTFAWAGMSSVTVGSKTSFTSLSINPVSEVASGSKSLSTIVKALSKVAHSHSFSQTTGTLNCHCKCDCDCSDDNCN